MDVSVYYLSIRWTGGLIRMVIDVVRYSITNVTQSKITVPDDQMSWERSYNYVNGIKSLLMERWSLISFVWSWPQFIARWKVSTVVDHKRTEMFFVRLNRMFIFFTWTFVLSKLRYKTFIVLYFLSSFSNNKIVCVSLTTFFWTQVNQSSDLLHARISNSKVLFSQWLRLSMFEKG